MGNKKEYIRLTDSKKRNLLRDRRRVLKNRILNHLIKILKYD